MLFAVMFPILVLAYCYNKFEFDRATYLPNMEVFPAGSFERRARMIANPSQIALFRVGFDSLRIQTVLDFTVRIAMNLSFCNRFKRVVEILLARHSRIGTSNSACHAYPQCVIHAFRSTSQEWCPCLTLIDVDRTPTTVDDRWSPVDATDIVKALAQSGDLRVLQLINRRPFRLPEELQRCRSLQYISLLYSALEEFPPWAKDLKKLEFVHVEGRQTSRNLLQIPDNLFQDLPVLTFLQLGIHRYLQRLPPLLGVPNLRSLVFARTFSITELPSFERLQKLERLELAYLPMLRTLPDMKPLINLVHFAVYRASPICCNGFASACNLTDSFCQADPIQILPAASCLKDDESRASPATQHFFETFASTICQKPASNLVLVSDIPTNKTIKMCGGVQFRECRIPNSDDSSTAGICFRSRMQVLACTPDPNKVKLRKLQIARRVDPICDPVVEKWLGCE
uniref:WLGC domain-containing protein n=1 Tax=Globisporangium ultimum (strain ATCC 200006 / CBS 805.95 / DAOM BR144) TaxID=431595 RepID=K3X7V5_GLOUD